MNLWQWFKFYWYRITHKRFDEPNVPTDEELKDEAGVGDGVVKAEVPQAIYFMLDEDGQCAARLPFDSPDFRIGLGHEGSSLDWLSVYIKPRVFPTSLWGFAAETIWDYTAIRWFRTRQGMKSALTQMKDDLKDIRTFRAAVIWEEVPYL